MDQLSFASLEYATKKKRTKREAFLAEMAAVVPWAKLEGVIEPHYPKSGPQGGRLPFPLPVMLRIYCLQKRFLRNEAARRCQTEIATAAAAALVLVAASGRPHRIRRSIWQLAWLKPPVRSFVGTCCQTRAERRRSHSPYGSRIALR
jgi:hypothetical protein